MQTASTKVGPHTYHSTDPSHVLVFAFDHDLHTAWPDYGYALPPSSVRLFIEQRYGDILDAHCFTRRRSTFDRTRMPITRRSLTEARAWVEAGFIALHDLWDHQLIAAHILRYVNLLRPDTIVCIGDTSISAWVINALRARGLRVVIISPLPANELGERSVETLSLRDIAVGNVPPLPETKDGKPFAEAWARMLKLPLRPETDVFAQMEWRDPILHARIMNLLSTGKSSHPPDSLQGLVYQYQNGTLPDLILALMLTLEDAPDAEDSSIRVDQRALLDRLRAYGLSVAPGDDARTLQKRMNALHDAGVQALLILHETDILLKTAGTIATLDAPDNPAFYFANIVEQLPVARYARAFCSMLRHARRQDASAVGVREVWRPSVTGKAFLDACYAALEILYFNPDGLTEETQRYLNTLWQINRSSIPEQLYAHFGVTDAEDIAAFNGRMKSLLAEMAFDPRPQEEDEPVRDSGARPVSLLPAEKTSSLKTAS